MSIHIQLAQAEDDAKLRALLRENVMEGEIGVSFRREPSYFAVSRIQGASAQVFKGVNTQTGELAGLGARFRLPAYVNGELMDIGYLADLRLNVAYRAGLTLQRSYDFLRQQHAQQPLPVYTTMILKDNHLALNALTRNRARLPPYLPLGLVHTPMLLLGWQKAEYRVDGIHIRQAEPADTSAVFQFINQQHQRRQFAPYYCPDDLVNGRLHGLRIQDFYLACKENGQIVGALAVWEQSAFRQIHVEHYRGIWRYFRPIYNGLCRFTPFAPLPAVSEKLRCAYISLLAIEHDDLAVCRALLRTVYRAHCGGGWHYLVCAFHERDPLLPVLADYAKISAGGYLFQVQFDEQPFALDGRVPYVEAGAL